MTDNDADEWIWGATSRDASQTSEEETDQESRRNVLRYVAGGATVGAIGILGLGFGSQPVVAATTSLTAQNLTITSNAGQLQTLTVQPSMDYEWSGLDNEPDRIDFYVDARLQGGSYEEVGAEGTAIDSTALKSPSTKTYDFANTVDILSHSSISDTDFEDTGGAWTKDTTVELRIRTELTDAGGNTFNDTNTTTFIVTLENEPGNANAGGNANPGGSAR